MYRDLQTHIYHFQFSIKKTTTMPLKYHLVRRRNMAKDAPEGSTLLYGQIRAGRRISFDRLCSEVSRISTASRGDVQLVIATMLDTMNDHLAEGDIIQMGELGNFRFSAGSKGAADEEEFNTSFFKKGKVIFTPGNMLRTATKRVSYEKLGKQPVSPSGNNEGDDEGSL